MKGADICSLLFTEISVLQYFKFHIVVPASEVEVSASPLDFSSLEVDGLASWICFGRV